MTTAAQNRLVRSATAQWHGTLAPGESWLSTDSQALAQARYSFRTRFAQEVGINPEELIAAAHAGCYSMALAYTLGQAGTPPQHVETTAALTMRRPLPA
jgi:osmotically inducible protein OsmC